MEGMYREVEGDLIMMALTGEFDVVAHGCNCQCKQMSGLAPQMVKAFATDKYSLEDNSLKGNINKLGQIEYEVRMISTEGIARTVFKGASILDMDDEPLYVVNAYTQFNYGQNHIDGDSVPLDYEALTLCMRKINKIFMGMRIGLPRIGCGLAGGRWSVVKGIIQKELKDCQVTIVNYKNV